MKKFLRNVGITAAVCAVAAAVGFVVDGESGAGLAAAFALLLCIVWLEAAEKHAKKARFEELDAKQYRHPLTFSKHEMVVEHTQAEFLESAEHYNARNAARLAYLQDELKSRRKDPVWLDEVIAELDENEAETGKIIAHSVEMMTAYSLNAMAMHLARVDGEVNREEFEAFRGVMLEDADAEFAEGFFEYVRDGEIGPGGFEFFAESMAEEHGPGDSKLVHALRVLWEVAAADGKVSPREEAMLADIARIFKLSRKQIAAAKSRHQRSSMPDIDPLSAMSDYEILGVSPQATDREVRRAFRKRVREFHPDAVAGKGVPSERVTRAGRQMAAVNAAFARIRKERGF